MGLKKRIGTAVRNINDIMVFGYVRGQDFQPESQPETKECSLSVDKKDFAGDFPGWEIKTDSVVNNLDKPKKHTV